MKKKANKLNVIVHVPNYVKIREKASQEDSSDEDSNLLISAAEKKQPTVDEMMIKMVFGTNTDTKLGNLKNKILKQLNGMDISNAKDIWGIEEKITAKDLDFRVAIAPETWSIFNDDGLTLANYKKGEGKAKQEYVELICFDAKLPLDICKNIIALPEKEKVIKTEKEEEVEGEEKSTEANNEAPSPEHEMAVQRLFSNLPKKAKRVTEVMDPSVTPENLGGPSQ